MWAERRMNINNKHVHDTGGPVRRTGMQARAGGAVGAGGGNLPLGVCQSLLSAQWCTSTWQASLSNLQRISVCVSRFKAAPNYVRSWLQPRHKHNLTVEGWRPTCDVMLVLPANCHLRRTHRLTEHTQDILLSVKSFWLDVRSDRQEAAREQP